MSRKPLVAGNWKLNMNKAETQSFIDSLAPNLDDSALSAVDVMVTPPFTSLDTALSSIKNSAKDIKLVAQNLSQYDSGAYTGEIAGSMLKEIGVQYVLVGHSERRENFQEDDQIINGKLKAAFSHGLNVILCCGESEATREAGTTDTWVVGQIKAALADVDAGSDLASKLVVAYEPIWAIGTGKTCDAAEANRVIKLIRSSLADIFDATTASTIRILYGGSVKSSNIEEIIQESDIDGALVGGASLKQDEFVAIVGAAAKAPQKT